MTSITLKQLEPVVLNFERRKLTRRLDTARAEIRALRAHRDRICRTPVEPEAQAVAEQHWATAERAATRVRERSERLVAELDARRRESEAEHRNLMREAGERIVAATREAERRRRELDERAAALRDEVRVDFEVAMSARRAEAMAAMAEEEAAARARAERVVREAEDHARRIVTDARRQVEELRGRRDRIAAGLRDARALLAEATPLLHAAPDEIPAQRTPTDLDRSAATS
ncbi:hypothetical protein AB0K14_21975 [Actinosynnema sp. NPDC050801]|uniref:hypothetical protein n=1 Tax=unclassified Actinosynnema TaxID=2637065 RepID=UPI0034052ABF